MSAFEIKFNLKLAYWRLFCRTELSEVKLLTYISRLFRILLFSYILSSAKISINSKNKWEVETSYEGFYLNVGYAETPIY